MDDRFQVDPSGCWTWQRGRTSSGYGEMWRNGRVVYAHRVFYEDALGPIPEGLTLDHLCRNRACVNPEHLEAVTVAENNRRGLKTKLTWDAVREIRAAIGVSRDELAARFGVSAPTISHIRHHRTWQEA